ncbi:mitochondrial proton/calcium exchanger protein [Galendromus occidentalis]|uniref:Mitochondrial proton/calcium exchanger protein n=1 Tax=Galendromus occidentalis TaxID=34638 RepID=A0AAJ7P9S5_9ACAR|nr:mitochondrial proton/calcium exchanger protein [Galendromus occidentalis]
MYRLCCRTVGVSRAVIAASRSPGRAGLGQRDYQLRLHQQPVPFLRFSTVVPPTPTPQPPLPPPAPPSQAASSSTDEETLDPSSKVEKTVKALRKEGAEKSSAQAPKPVARKEDHLQVAPPKRSLRKRIWDELVHYYHGFRLLFIDVRVCSQLLYRILKGEDLSRREHKQLVRTTSDLFRLVPFSVFIIVPFMELLLPIAVQLFPGMLPSTFQDPKDQKAKFKTQLKMKLEMAKFLQTTLDEMAVKNKGEVHSHAAKEFALFCERIRESGNFASSEEILKFSKLFEDELTLDSLGRQQLVALCRLLDIQTLGTTQLLRFQLRMRLKNLKNDDAVIKKEGLDSLTVSELQAACRARGMRALGIPEEKLRYQLNQWLDLSLRESIPPSLLLLSRAMLLPETVNATEQLRETITQLPMQAITEAKFKIGETEGKVDNRTKLELIRQEELAIKEERRELKRAQEEEQVAEAKRKEKEKLKDVAPLEAVSAAETEMLVDSAKTIKADEEKKLSKEDLENLEDAIETIALEKKKLLVEKEELDDLKEEMKDYEEDVKELVEVTRGTGELSEGKGAHRLYKKVDAMIKNLDNVIDKLNEEKAELKQKDVKDESVRDDIIGINELVLLMHRLKKSSDASRVQMIQEVLDTIDSDHDGKIEIDLVLKVIDLVGRENVKVDPKHMKEIINLLLREEALKKNREKEAAEAAKTSGAANTQQKEVN